MTEDAASVAPQLRRSAWHRALFATLTLAAMLICLLAVHAAISGQEMAGHEMTGHSVGTPLGPDTGLETGTPPGPDTGLENGTAPGPDTGLETGSRLGPDTVGPALAPPAVVMTVAATIGQRLLCFENNTMDGGTLLAMTCSVLLVLETLILLARRPSLYDRLLESIRLAVATFGAVPLAVHRPSLTLLSISRT